MILFFSRDCSSFKDWKLLIRACAEAYLTPFLIEDLFVSIPFEDVYLTCINFFICSAFFASSIALRSCKTVSGRSPCSILSFTLFAISESIYCPALNTFSPISFLGTVIITYLSLKVSP